MSRKLIQNLNITTHINKNNKDPLMTCKLNIYMMNPANFDTILNYFNTLLNDGKKETLCQFLLILMNDYSANDGRISELVNDIVYILTKSYFPVSHLLKFKFSEFHQKALLNIFTNTNYVPKDWVLMRFDDLVCKSLSYFLRMFIWDFCPNHRMQITIRLFNEFEDCFLFSREKSELFDFYVPCLIGTMLPYMVVARGNHIKIADKSTEEFLYSDSLVRNIINTISLIFRGYIVPTTMKKYLNYCMNNDNNNSTFNSTYNNSQYNNSNLNDSNLNNCNQDYLSNFNSMVTSIHLIIQNLDIPTLLSDAEIGLFASAALPDPIRNIEDLTEITNKLIGTSISAVANQLLFFLSFFHHVINYYCLIGSSSNDILFTINYDSFIRQFMKVAFQIIDYDANSAINNNLISVNNYLNSVGDGSCNNQRSNLNLNLTNNVRNASNDYSAIDIHIHWINYILAIVVNNSCLEGKLVTYLMDCRPNHLELFILFLQTDCITLKNILSNKSMLDIFDQRDIYSSIYKSTAVKLIKLPLYFNEGNTELFMSTVVDIFQRIVDDNYISGPAVGTLWCMTCDEARNIETNNVSAGIRTLPSKCFCWVRSTHDVLRYIVSATLAYILKAQLETNLLDPFLLGVIIVLSQHFKQYHFLVAFVTHWHITVFPDIYLRLYRNYFSLYISNMYLSEKLVSIFQTQLHNNCTYTPSEFIYGSDRRKLFSSSKMSLVEYQHTLTEVCHNLPKLQRPLNEEIRLMCDFMKIYKTKIVVLLNSFQRKAKQMKFAADINAE